MTITQYLKRKDIRVAVKPADIETYTKNHKKLTRDKRSYQKDGMWYLQPIGESGNSVDIICPYCGEIHRHGNAPGHRISHCLSSNNPGYVLVIGGTNNGK